MVAAGNNKLTFLKLICINGMYTSWLRGRLDNSKLQIFIITNFRIFPPFFWMTTLMSDKAPALFAFNYVALYFNASYERFSMKHLFKYQVFGQQV